MLKINQAQSNQIVVTLTEKQTLSNPYFLFVFTHEQTNNNSAVILSDTSLYTRRYNEFTFIEGTDLNLISGDYEYNVYEQTSDSNLNPALADNLLETGKARVLGDVETENYYTPTDEANNIFDYPYLTTETGLILTDENNNTLVYE